MCPLAVLFAATTLMGTPAHHETKHANQAAAQHAAAQQQKSYEQALHRQMEEEQRMMKHLAEQQQKSIHEQMKARLQSPNHGTTVPVQPHHQASRGYAGRPYGSSRSGSHHSYVSSHRGYHHPYQYRHHRTWPSQQDPELAALNHLKQTLDGVQMNHSATNNHKTAIEQALMRVVESPRTPSLTSLGRLSGHLANAMAHRTSATIDTRTVALALRGGVNSPMLMNAERAEVLRELETALKHGGVPQVEVASVVSSLKSVEHEEQARR